MTNENNDKFIPDLYQTLVFIVGVVLPLLLAPPTILVAAVRYNQLFLFMFDNGYRIFVDIIDSGKIVGNFGS